MLCKGNTANPKFSKENFPTTTSASQHHTIVTMATKTEKITSLNVRLTSTEKLPNTLTNKEKDP